jgi:hypothetical protein
MKFFEYLDEQGGFYYERWGDAPVHSIGAALLAKKEQIHFFEDIGYRHEPFQVSAGVFAAARVRLNRDAALPAGQLSQEGQVLVCRERQLRPRMVLLPEQIRQTLRGVLSMCVAASSYIYAKVFVSMLSELLNNNTGILYCVNRASCRGEGAFKLRAVAHSLPERVPDSRDRV